MKMHSLLLAASASLAALAVAGAASAQAIEDDTADVKIAFVAPVSVAKATDMDFLTYTRPSVTGGTVVISPTGVRSVGTAATGLGPVGSAAGTPAAFTVSAEDGSSVTLTVTQTAGAATYPLSNFTASGCGASATGSFTFDITGANCTIAVGATMGVPANATGGTAVATLKAELKYN